MIICFYILLAMYVAMIISLLIGYGKIQVFTFSTSEENTSNTKFSVVIPFRNEAKNLPELLESISFLNYPESSYEILFVDDDSEDSSVQIIEEFFKKHQDLKSSFQILNNKRNSNSPKKDAITAAIKSSKHTWIITTDADCILPENWLNNFDAFIQKNDSTMVVGPLNYISEKSIENNYQQFDNFSLQATTIGSFGLHLPILSNGANLAYKKEVFYQVDGFTGNNHVASGDDIFLLEKFKKYNASKVLFLKSIDAIVKTKAEISWKDIIKQRIRWASKTSKQKNSFSKGLGVLVFITSLMYISLLILSVTNPFYWIHFTILFVLKTIVDGTIMYHHARTFKLKFNIFSFLICEVIYPFITVIIVLGSIFGTYTWKNRTFKK